MARKVINIGTTGNDATGDSIREGFNKVNQNFTEIYASLGLGGGLTFASLDDTPSTLAPNKVLATNTAGDAVNLRTIEGEGIAIDFTSDPTKLTLRTTGTEIRLDTTPELGGDLNAQTFLIENLGTPEKDQDAVTKKYADDKFLDAAGDIATGIIKLQNSGQPRVPNSQDEAVNKKYADTKVRLAGDTMTGPLVLSQSPTFTSSSLQAATKEYVDNNSFTSKKNLFVSTNGRTEQEMISDGVDRTQIGRSLAYAFNNVREAAFYAERIIKGDITLKDQGLLTGDVIFPVPGRKPGPYTVNMAADGTEDTTYVLANKLFVNNREFIQRETLAYIEAEINDGDNSDDFASNFTFNREKCFRDIGLIIDAVSFDLTYVGNSKTVDAAASYWDGATSRVAGQQTETVAALEFAKNLIQNNVLTNTAYVAPANTENPNAVALIDANREYIADETIAYIEAQIAAGAGIWNGFTYDKTKCERDVKIILDGISFDLKYGGNSKSRENASRYWNGVTSYVAGQQPQTVDALNFTKDLVRSYIILNTAYTSRQSVTEQVINSNNGESAASTKINTLMNMIADVITNGLGNLPVLEGTYSNQSGAEQFIDTTVIAETGASTEIGNLMDIVTDVITNGLGALPAKIGGQGREQNVPLPEVTIHIESGFYEELTPIVLPENCSIKGDEFRRVIIQSKVGVRPPQRALDLTFERGDQKRYDGTGTPKAARFRNHYDSQYSRADTGVGVNQTGAAQIRLKDLVYYPRWGQYFTYNGTTYYVKEISFDPDGVEDFTRADLSLYSDINLTTTTTLQDDIPNNTVIELKMLNQHCDVFLVNNATILRNITVRRHQGAIMVLDPEGQILTKSPYVQTCSSFSSQGGSGQYVDGNAGVQYGTVVDNPASGFEITLKGLTRGIQIPTTFLYQGSGGVEKKTYRVIGVTAPVDDGDGNTPVTYKQKLTLAADTEIKVDSKTLPAGTIPQGDEIRIETAGNKSMTSNDYTQVNNDGYGLVATNNGLVETVSVFTYYCDTAYWARNGGQIRSLNGSNAYGRLALKAEGSDPNENIQSGAIFFRELNATVEADSTRQDFSQPMKVHNPANTAAGTGDTDLEIRDFNYRPMEGSKFRLTAYSSNNDGTDYSVDELEDVTINVTGITIASEAVFTTSVDHYYREGAMVFVSGANANGMNDVDGAYYVKVVSSNTFKLCTDTALTTFLDTTTKGNPSYGGTGCTVKGGGRAVLKLGQALAIGTGTRVPDGSEVIIKIGKKVTVRNLTDTPRVLPSSALTFATGDQTVFRILGVERLVTNEVNDPNVDFQLMSLDLQFPQDRFNTDVVKVTTAISTLRATGHDFMNIGWGNYANSNYPNNVFGAPAGRPDFAADQASEAVEVGAGRVFYASTDQDGNFRVGKFFRVNQGDGSVELNANISLTNVDGLGFTKGTVVDEFSTDDKLLGKSDDAVPTEASIVTYLNSAIIGQHEDGTSFPEWTTTGSQAGGTFGVLSRAGYNGTNLSWNRMYGELNMGTNKITNISMTGAQDVDGVNKLYADNVFRGATTDSIRTDVKAFTMLNDSTLDSGAIDMNGNRIKSMRDPEDGSDAVTKQYVDEQNRIGGLEGVTITGNPNNTDLLMFSGSNHTDGLGNAIQGAVNVSLDTTVDNTGGSPTFGEPTGTGSDVRIIRTNNEINIQLANGAVKNADVSAAAAIAQSKLNMNAATTRANASGITQADLGLASFDNTEFSATDGFITLKTPTISNPNDGVTLDKLEFITGTSILGNSQVSENAVEALTPSEVRSLIDFDNSVEAYIDENVLDNNGALVKTGGTMTGTLQTLNVRPASNETSDLGLTTARYRNIYTKQVNTDTIQEARGNIVNITAITKTDPAVITTSVAHGFKNGDKIKFLNIGGMTELNGLVKYVGGVTTNSFEIYQDAGLTNGTDTSGFTTYTSGGTASTIFDLVLGTDGTEILILDKGNNYTDSRFIGSSDTLTTARTFTFTGAATGTVDFDGSQDVTVTLAAAVAAGSPYDGTYLRRNGLTDDTNMTGVLGTKQIVPSDGVSGGVNTLADNSYDIGASNNRYANVHAVRFEGTASEAEFADLAEKYLADTDYEEGTVLMFGGEQEVTASNKEGTTKVAGVVSTAPGYTMNNKLEGDHVTMLALQGRVPCKVVGRIEKGDMIVASSIVGVGTASEDPKLGSVIGKALENYDSDEVGVIEVVVGRQ